MVTHRQTRRHTDWHATYWPSPVHCTGLGKKINIFQFYVKWGGNFSGNIYFSSFYYTCAPIDKKVKTRVGVVVNMSGKIILVLLNLPMPII